MSRTTSTHVYFWSGVYCQWYACSFKEGDIKYSSAEQYMMAQKAKVFEQEVIFDKIIKSTNSGYAKELGRKIPNFSNEKWDKYKLDIVTQGNYLKFSQNLKLLKQLINQKDLIIVEASPVDKIWGIGLHFNDDKILDETQWRGENLLGKCIMKARTKILKEISNET